MQPRCGHFHLAENNDDCRRQRTPQTAEAQCKKGFRGTFRLFSSGEGLRSTLTEHCKNMRQAFFGPETNRRSCRNIEPRPYLHPDRAPVSVAVTMASHSRILHRMRAADLPTTHQQNIIVACQARRMSTLSRYSIRRRPLHGRVLQVRYGRVGLSSQGLCPRLSATATTMLGLQDLTVGQVSGMIAAAVFIGIWNALYWNKSH
jgi:hypothetical protein